MRELKFRAWNGEILNYFTLETLLKGYGDDAPFTPNGENPLFYTDKPIMQYVGVKDKNSKDIYEGDFVRKKRTDKRFKNKFEYRTVSYLFQRYRPEKLELWEIIGNIYENPELLENK